MHEEVVAAGFGDVGLAHFNILQHPTPDGLRPTEVAARADDQAGRESPHPPPGDAGYLALEPDPRDQRARIVRLTPRGWELIATIRAVVEDVESEWARRLGPRRFATLRGILTELGESLG